MGVRRLGDWAKAKAKLADNPRARHALAIRQATIKNALLLIREIKRGIRSQEPVGKAFVKLAESTIARKGSSKALIDTGSLFNSITQRIFADWAFMGLLRGTTKDGDHMVNIGAVIVIPPRPFLHPIMEKYRELVIENYRQAIRSVI